MFTALVTIGVVAYIYMGLLIVFWTQPNNSVSDWDDRWVLFTWSVAWPVLIAWNTPYFLRRLGVLKRKK